jgi:hypothetical protein
VSNVYTTLSQANDKLSALQSMASIAAAQIEAGAQSHGTGAILEVALIASAISQGALTYNNAGKTATFDKPKAIAAARLIYNRFATEYGEGVTGEFPFGHDGKELSAWRGRTLMMLHPYSYNRVVYDWTKTSKSLTAEIMQHHSAKKPSEQTTIKSQIMDAFDRTDKARIAAKKLWDIACLYVALDDNGALLQNSETDPKTTKSTTFGLKMRVSFFIPYKKSAVSRDVTKEVLLTPVDRRSGALHYFEDTTTGTEGDMKSVRVSLDSFDAAWKLPKPKPVAATDDWRAAFVRCAELNPAVELSAEATLAFRTALNAMIDYSKHLETLANGPQPEVVADPKAMKASDIASGKSLPSHMRLGAA